MQKEKAKITGWHTFKWCDMRSKMAIKLQAEINELLKTGTPRSRHNDLKSLLSDLYRLYQTNELSVPNIIPTAGRSVIASWITGDNTIDADAGANYGSLGTGSTTPANSDTQLSNEVYRKATSSATTVDNIAYLAIFYSATEVTGTFQEAGWHIDGTGSANTGELLSHFLTGTLTKSNIESLTVESELTIS